MALFVFVVFLPEVVHLIENATIASDYLDTGEKMLKQIDKRVKKLKNGYINIY
ncbi:hypothetical protein [Niallia sp. 03133]|uniref:hypothetical protein n=1 Tax=Niallia sp. 03133 TaxID=3458060 RepID=UPI004043955B